MQEVRSHPLFLGTGPASQRQTISSVDPFTLFARQLMQKAYRKSRGLRSHKRPIEQDQCLGCKRADRTYRTRSQSVRLIERLEERQTDIAFIVKIQTATGVFAGVGRGRPKSIRFAFREN